MKHPFPVETHVKPRIIIKHPSQGDFPGTPQIQWFKTSLSVERKKVTTRGNAAIYIHVVVYTLHWGLSFKTGSIYMYICMYI